MLVSVLWNIHNTSKRSSFRPTKSCQPTATPMRRRVKVSLAGYRDIFGERDSNRDPRKDIHGNLTYSELLK